MRDETIAPAPRPLKQLSVRKVGPVRLTSASASFYGDPITCPVGPFPIPA
jgi:hypothetical protein